MRSISRRARVRAQHGRMDSAKSLEQAPAGDAAHLWRLQRRCGDGPAPEFLFFWDHAAPRGAPGLRQHLSQWSATTPFALDGVAYATAEHFLMAAKAALFGDEATRQLILHAATPGEAKALGREVQGFDEAVWARHRYAIVLRGNVALFGQYPALREELLSTHGTVLAQASPLDAVWGTGLSAAHPDARHPARWPGLNLLGFALMEARERLRAGQDAG